jgi:hypothetical protein
MVSKVILGIPNLNVFLKLLLFLGDSFNLNPHGLTYTLFSLAFGVNLGPSPVYCFHRLPLDGSDITCSPFLIYLKLIYANLNRKNRKILIL